MATGFAKDQPTGFKNHLENIAVVGAGGQVGKYIVEALIANGKHKVTALTREGSSNTIPAGVHAIRKIDYAQPSTIADALKGQDALICTLSVRATEEAEKLSRAAAEAGVKWILPNEFGNSKNSEQIDREIIIGVKKGQDRKLIEELGVSSWIGIATGFWYEYSLSAVGLGVANLLALKVLPEDENDKSTTLSQFRNDFVCLSSFKVSQQQIFGSLLKVTGTSRDDWKITSEPVKERYAMGQAMLQTGDPRGFGVLLYSRAFYPDEAGQHPRNDNADLGLPEEDLDEWTTVAVKMVEEDYFLKEVLPRTTG
uniref:Isoflavone reductase like IRL n=1 Tax=Talaromyces marneffei PM1 TaxID=1077442 RepID=A0A093V819_TALMA